MPKLKGLSNLDYAVYRARTRLRQCKALIKISWEEQPDGVYERVDRIRFADIRVMNNWLDKALAEIDFWVQAKAGKPGIPSRIKTRTQINAERAERKSRGVRLPRRGAARKQRGV